MCRAANRQGGKSSPCPAPHANYTRIADQNVAPPTSTQHSTGQLALHKQLLALSIRCTHQIMGLFFLPPLYVLVAFLRERSGRRQPPAERSPCIYHKHLSAVFFFLQRQLYYAYSVPFSTYGTRCNARTQAQDNASNTQCTEHHHSRLITTSSRPLRVPAWRCFICCDAKAQALAMYRVPSFSPISSIFPFLPCVYPIEGASYDGSSSEDHRAIFVVPQPDGQGQGQHKANPPGKGGPSETILGYFRGYLSASCR